MAAPQWQQVSTHGWAWVDEDGRHGNCGLVAQGAHGLLVNTRHDRLRTRELLSATAEVLPETRIERVAVTDAGPHRWGGLGALDGAECLVAHAAADGMRERISPAGIVALAHSTDPALPLGRYLRDRLGGTAPGDALETPPPGTFTGHAGLRVGDVPVELIDVGPALAASDTVVWLPEESLLFTGDLLSPGRHPAAWSGSLDAWHAACARLAALRPLTVVPGRGALTDILGVIDFRDYLHHLGTEIERRYERGMPVEEAAVDIPAGRWEHWSGRENLAVTVATAYRALGAGGEERTFEETATLAAEIATGLRPRPRIAPMTPVEQRGQAAEMLGLAAGEAAIFDFHKANLPNIHTTLVRHAQLYEQTVPIARGVVSGLLADRDREMVILRSAWRCSATYQWSHHRHMALSVGLGETEVDLLSHDIAKGSWTRHEQALLRAVDELHAGAAVTDATWAVLAESFGDAELIELVTLIGEYHKVSFQLNSWRVPLEGWAGPYRLPSGWVHRDDARG